MLDEATTITCNTELPEFPPLDSLPVGVCLLFLDRAGASQNTAHPLVAFVTRRLEDLIAPIVGLDERHLNRPRPGERRRILDRHAVDDHVRLHALVPLDETEVLCGAEEIRLVREIRRLDDQRVGLPTAARVSKPLPDL